jgi:DNA-directed RNA polymerase specialized sigma24 family protein
MDSDWLGRLVDRHAAALELFARQWCDTPEDVIQEAFVKLVSARTRPENPTAWLFHVVRNGALNAAKAAQRRRPYESDDAAEST